MQSVKFALEPPFAMKFPQSAKLAELKSTTTWHPTRTAFLINTISCRNEAQNSDKKTHLRPFDASINEVSCVAEANTRLYSHMARINVGSRGKRSAADIVVSIPKSLR